MGSSFSSGQAVKYLKAKKLIQLTFALGNCHLDEQPEWFEGFQATLLLANAA